MNRRERKLLEKKLGLHKYLKNLSRSQQFERMRQNIIEGKKKEKEMKEIVRLQTEENQIQSDNLKIASLATELMIKENLSYIDALEKAKNLIR